jgi:hypothetical protein
MKYIFINLFFCTVSQNNVLSLRKSLLPSFEIGDGVLALMEDILNTSSKNNSTTFLD